MVLPFETAIEINLNRVQFELFLIVYGNKMTVFKKGQLSKCSYIFFNL